MGALEVGDEVFDERGVPCRVLAATDVLLGRPCREVELSDGSLFIADAAHQWVTTSAQERRPGRPRTASSRTTDEIARTLTSGNEFSHQIALAGPAQYPSADLPIDPYVLGVCIGEGTATKAEITCDGEPIVRELALAGYAPEAQRARPLVSGILGLVDGKRIPAEYLTACVAQRQAFLEGLMDTGGYVDRWGRCGLTTVKPGLAEQYRELLASLGFGPVVATKTATLNRRACGLEYDVIFTPDRPVFRLPHKRERQKGAGRFQRSRAIVAVNPTDSVPVRCVQVASPRGVFLVSRSFIPTHNSSLGRLGLIVHATAGFVDPGFKGTLTLEITNFNSVPIVLRPDLPIAQLSFLGLDRPAEVPYGHPELGSHYLGQRDATESRYEGGRRQ
jgi:dUTPase